MEYRRGEETGLWAGKALYLSILDFDEERRGIDRTGPVRGRVSGRLWGAVRIMTP